MQIIEKIPNGKLVRLTVNFNIVNKELVIKDCKINGDFFAYPEDVIENLESDLLGARLNDVESIVKKSTEDAELFGLTHIDLSRLITRCFHESTLA